MRGFARAYDMSPHHKSAILYKRNQLLSLFEPTQWLDRRNFGEFVLNYLVMGNAYLEERRSRLNRPMAFLNSPAIHTRRGVDEGAYWWVPGHKLEAQFDGRVFHLWEPDLAQELYGLPEYTSALQSGLLNFDATIFRRKYYLNGSHAGYILYVTDEHLAAEDADAIEQAIDDSKGPGNFRNLFLHAPGGREKGLQVIPVGEVAAKDEFLGIKGTTAADVMTAHRVPPVLVAQVPQNTGGFGDVAKTADVFHFAEIVPLMMRMLEVNDWAGVEAVRFRSYQPMSVTLPGAAAK